MLDRLDDVETLRTRTRRPIVWACALAGATLAPLVDELILGGVFSDGYALTVGQLSGFGAWAVLLGAVLGGLVGHFGLAPRPQLGRHADTLLLATLAGIAHCALVIVAPAIDHAFSGAPRAMEALGAPFLAGTLGAVVSGPVGFAFGVLLLLGIAPTRTHLDRLTHDAPVSAWRWAAVLLATASFLAFCLIAVLEGSYCQALFLVLLPALGIALPAGSDLAWTRFVVVPTPLAIASLAALLHADRLALHLARAVSSLHRGDHPRWVTAAVDPALCQGQLALRDADLRAPELGVHERHDGAPYRDRGQLVALLSKET